MIFKVNHENLQSLPFLSKNNSTLCAGLFFFHYLSTLLTGMRYRSLAVITQHVHRFLK